MVFELAVGAAHDAGVPEATSAAGITFVLTLIQIVFLLVPVGDPAWMNWVVLVSVVGAVPAMCAFKPRYARLEADLKRQRRRRRRRDGGVEEEDDDGPVIRLSWLDSRGWI